MDDVFQGKSAKMWVHEICVKQLVQAMYETVPAGVPPNFICRCRIKYKDRIMEAEACAKTKKEAEQAAAKQILLKMGMTPAKLMAINNASRKNVSSSSSPNSDNNAEENVSDTDDDALELSVNPIGDLVGICAIYEFGVEPKYEQENEEGPPHKRIFTMRCSLVVHKKQINFSFAGRRPKKQVAKKLAAFRVLRELQKLGYKYESYEERASNGLAEAAGEEVVIKPPPKNSECTLEEISEKFEYEVTAEEKERIKQFLSGPRLYCDNNSSENCLKFLSGHHHAFQHLGKSETVDYILAAPSLSAPLEEFGGPVALLKKICKELKVTLAWKIAREEDFTGGCLMFVQLGFPFDFKHNLPPVSVLTGTGNTTQEAKIEAATGALEFIRTMFMTC